MTQSLTWMAGIERCLLLCLQCDCSGHMVSPSDCCLRIKSRPEHHNLHTPSSLVPHLLSSSLTRLISAQLPFSYIPRSRVHKASMEVHDRSTHP